MPKPPHSQNSLKANDGFVAIVAIGIFALLAIFGIIIQQTVQDTYLSVKSTNNYYSARDIADSTTEYMLWTLTQYDVGYNTENADGGTVIHCEFADGEAAPVNHDLCAGLASLVDTRTVVVDMEIKGRALDSENLETAACYTDPFLASQGVSLINDSCYVVPFPGTGDVGKRCNGYEPVFDGADSATIDSDLITGGNILNEDFNEVDQVDYSCNWNKLSFGSSATAGVAIPLYYDDGNGNIVNPFNGGGATTIALRLRTPCKPCGQLDEDGNPLQGTRECASGQDPTVCIDDRFKLNEGDGDDIVVQWQLMGTCDDAEENPQECSMVAKSTGLTPSTISESKINDAVGNIVIENNTIGLLIHIHPQIEGRLVTPNNAVNPPIVAQLPIYAQPVLNLFLNEALVSDNGLNIPYLEYQVFTDKPIANPKTKVEVTVSVDGNAFTKTLFRENQQTIIDFAIQN